MSVDVRNLEPVEFTAGEGDARPGNEANEESSYGAKPAQEDLPAAHGGLAEDCERNEEEDDSRATLCVGRVWGSYVEVTPPENASPPSPKRKEGNQPSDTDLQQVTETSTNAAETTLGAGEDFNLYNLCLIHSRSPEPIAYRTRSKCQEHRPVAQETTITTPTQAPRVTYVSKATRKRRPPKTTAPSRKDRLKGERTVPTNHGVGHPGNQLTPVASNETGGNAGPQEAQVNRNRTNGGRRPRTVHRGRNVSYGSSAKNKQTNKGIQRKRGDRRNRTVPSSSSRGGHNSARVGVLRGRFPEDSYLALTGTQAYFDDMCLRHMIHWNQNANLMGERRRADIDTTPASFGIPGSSDQRRRTIIPEANFDSFPAASNENESEDSGSLCDRTPPSAAFLRSAGITADPAGNSNSASCGLGLGSPDLRSNERPGERPPNTRPGGSQATDGSSGDCSRHCCCRRVQKIIVTVSPCCEHAAEHAVSVRNGSPATVTAPALSGEGFVTGKYHSQESVTISLDPRSVSGCCHSSTTVSALEESTRVSQETRSRTRNLATRSVGTSPNCLRPGEHATDYFDRDQPPGPGNTNVFDTEDSMALSRDAPADSAEFGAVIENHGDAQRSDDGFGQDAFGGVGNESEHVRRKPTCREAATDPEDLDNACMEAATEENLSTAETYAASSPRGGEIPAPFRKEASTGDADSEDGREGSPEVQIIEVKQRAVYSVSRNILLERRRNGRSPSVSGGFFRTATTSPRAPPHAESSAARSNTHWGRHSDDPEDGAQRVAQQWDGIKKRMLARQRNSHAGPSTAANREEEGSSPKRERFSEADYPDDVSQSCASPRRRHLLSDIKDSPPGSSNSCSPGGRRSMTCTSLFSGRKTSPGGPASTDMNGFRPPALPVTFRTAGPTKRKEADKPFCREYAWSVEYSPPPHDGAMSEKRSRPGGGQLPTDRGVRSRRCAVPESSRSLPGERFSARQSTSTSAGRETPPAADKRAVCRKRNLSPGDFGEPCVDVSMIKSEWSDGEAENAVTNHAEEHVGGTHQVLEVKKEDVDETDWQTFMNGTAAGFHCGYLTGTNSMCSDCGGAHGRHLFSCPQSQGGRGGDHYRIDSVLSPKSRSVDSRGPVSVEEEAAEHSGDQSNLSTGNEDHAFVTQAFRSDWTVERPMPSLSPIHLNRAGATGDRSAAAAPWSTSIHANSERNASRCVRNDARRVFETQRRNPPQRTDGSLANRQGTRRATASGGTAERATPPPRREMMLSRNFPVNGAEAGDDANGRSFHRESDVNSAPIGSTGDRAAFSMIREALYRSNDELRSGQKTSEARRFGHGHESGGPRQNSEVSRPSAMSQDLPETPHPSRMLRRVTITNRRLTPSDSGTDFQHGSRFYTSSRMIVMRRKGAEASPVVGVDNGRNRASSPSYRTEEKPPTLMESLFGRPQSDSNEMADLRTTLTSLSANCAKLVKDGHSTDKQPVHSLVNPAAKSLSRENCSHGGVSAEEGSAPKVRTERVRKHCDDSPPNVTSCGKLERVVGTNSSRKLDHTYALKSDVPSGTSANPSAGHSAKRRHVSQLCIPDRNGKEVRRVGHLARVSSTEASSRQTKQLMVERRRPRGGDTVTGNKPASGNSEIEDHPSCTSADTSPFSPESIKTGVNSIAGDNIGVTSHQMEDTDLPEASVFWPESFKTEVNSSAGDNNIGVTDDQMEDTDLPEASVFSPESFKTEVNSSAGDNIGVTDDQMEDTDLPEASVSSPESVKTEVNSSAGDNIGVTDDQMEDTDLPEASVSSPESVKTEVNSSAGDNIGVTDDQMEDTDLPEASVSSPESVKTEVNSSAGDNIGVTDDQMEDMDTGSSDRSVNSTMSEKLQVCEDEEEQPEEEEEDEQEEELEEEEDDDEQLSEAEELEEEEEEEDEEEEEPQEEEDGEVDDDGGNKPEVELEKQEEEEEEQRDQSSNSPEQTRVSSGETD